MIFIDSEKVCDKISKNIIWWTLKKKKIPTMYVISIKDVYINVVTNVRAYDGESNVFSIKIELHQWLV
jgi:hypothetical protein